MNFWIIQLLLLFPILSLAQAKKTFRINPGQKAIQAIPHDEVFCYEQFVDGIVYFRNDRVAQAKMNYNSLYSEMQFIDAKGDTLSLDEEETIRFVVAGTDTFYYDGGFVLLKKDFGDIRLASRESFSFVNRQKMGGMGETNSASIDTYNAVSTSNYMKELVAREIITLSKSKQFFIGDLFNHYKPANKKSILDYYPEKEKAIKAYLKENKIDFTDEGDLQKLILHIKTIE